MIICQLSGCIWLYLSFTEVTNDTLHKPKYQSEKDLFKVKNVCSFKNMYLLNGMFILSEIQKYLLYYSDSQNVMFRRLTESLKSLANQDVQSVIMLIFQKKSYEFIN